MAEEKDHVRLYGPKEARAKAPGPDPELTDIIYNKLYTVIHEMLSTFGPAGTVGQLVILPVDTQQYFDWNISGGSIYPDIAQRTFCNVLPYNLGSSFEDGYEHVLFDAFKEPNSTVDRAKTRFDDPSNQETYVNSQTGQTEKRRIWQITPSAQEANAQIDSNPHTSEVKITESTTAIDWSLTWLSAGFNYGSCFFRVKEQADWVDLNVNAESSEFSLSLKFGGIATVTVNAGEWFNSSIVLSFVNNPNNFKEGWTKLYTPDNEFVLGDNGACNSMINKFYVYKDLDIRAGMARADYEANYEHFKNSKSVQVGCWSWDFEGGNTNYSIEFDESTSSVNIHTHSKVPIVLAQQTTRFQFE